MDYTYYVENFVAQMKEIGYIVSVHYTFTSNGEVSNISFTVEGRCE